MGAVPEGGGASAPSWAGVAFSASNVVAPPRWWRRTARWTACVQYAMRAPRSSAAISLRRGARPSTIVVYSPARGAPPAVLVRRSAAGRPERPRHRALLGRDRHHQRLLRRPGG